MTCGSCGASLRENPPASSSATPEVGTPDTGAAAPEDPTAPAARNADAAVATGTSAASASEAAPTEWAPVPPRSARRRRPLPPRPPAAASSPAFFSRAWAFVVDLMLLSLVGSLLPSAAWLGIRAAEAVSGTTELYDDVLTAQLTTIGEIVLVAGYFLFMHGSGGQTVGKSLMGLHVVGADGRPLDPGRSLARVCGYVFSALPLGVGFLLAAFPPRRALHDYLAGTIVVRARDMPKPEGEDRSV